MGVNHIDRIDCPRLVTSSIDFKRSSSCSSSDVVSSLMRILFIMVNTRRLRSLTLVSAIVLHRARGM